MNAAIDACKPGFLYRDLGAIIESIARKRKCQPNRTYCGHGINQLFHCAPNIPVSLLLLCLWLF